MLEFRDYQKQIIRNAVTIIRENAFVYLAMEVRTGKTLTALGTASYIDCKNLLFVTKKKAMSSIRDDYELLSPSYSITIINYESGTDEDPEPFGFIFPDSGATLWADVFVTPMGATHKRNVEKLIDFYYTPENAAELALWVNYISPVVGAQDAAAAMDPELAENQLIFPNADTLAKSQAFRSLTGQEEQRFASAWQNLLLGA